MALGLARRRRAHVGFLVMLGFVLVAAALVAAGGASPDWGALGTARDAVPALPSLPSLDPSLPSFGALRRALR
jgi:hypothetical protein